MKKRFRLVKRGSRNCKYYAFDTVTGKRASLQTSNREEALRLITAKNEAQRQGAINLQLARIYIQQTSDQFATRTWQNVMDELVARAGKASTKARASRAVQSRAFDPIRGITITETTADHFNLVLKEARISTNHFLRCMHNLAQGLGWLPWPIVPVKLWPAVPTKDKRAITWDEHQRIIHSEHNQEAKLFYELLWEIGAAQSDGATLTNDNLDWQSRTLAFQRMKTGTWCRLSIGERLEEILRQLPSAGPLFPRISQLRDSSRSAEFNRRCRLLQITGVTLHSYRYAWAERAKAAGMPERFAMENLGHNSKAVHRAYSKKALIRIPALEMYESKVIPMPEVEVIQG